MATDEHDNESTETTQAPSEAIANAQVVSPKVAKFSFAIRADPDEKPDAPKKLPSAADARAYAELMSPDLRGIAGEFESLRAAMQEPDYLRALREPNHLAAMKEPDHLRTMKAQMGALDDFGLRATKAQIGMLDDLGLMKEQMSSAYDSARGIVDAHESHRKMMDEALGFTSSFDSARKAIEGYDSHRTMLDDALGHTSALDSVRKSIAERANLGQTFGTLASFGETDRLMRDAMRDTLRSVHVQAPPAPAFPETIQVELAEHTEEAMDFRAGMADTMCEGIMRAVEAFQNELGPDEETILALANFGERMVVRVTEIHHYPPHLVEFSGTDTDGRPVRLLQHTSQVNMLLEKVKVPDGRPACRIGFHIAKPGKKR